MRVGVRPEKIAIAAARADDEPSTGAATSCAAASTVASYLGVSIQYVVETHDRPRAHRHRPQPRRRRRRLHRPGPRGRRWPGIPPTRSSSNDRRPAMSHEELDGIVERMLDGSEHSRRQFIRHLAGAGLLVGPGSAFLAACGGVKGESSGKKASTVAHHPKVADRQLDVLQLAALHRQEGAQDVRQAATAGTSSTSRTSTTTTSSSGRSASSCRPASRSAATSSSLTDYMAGRLVRDGLRRGDRQDATSRT